MTDYVDEQLTIAIAAEQRASFLQRVSLFRGSLENLEDSLRNDTLIYEPKDAWKISGMFTRGIWLPVYDVLYR